MSVHQFTRKGKTYRTGWSDKPSKLVELYHEHTGNGWQGHIGFSCRTAQWFFVVWKGA